MTYEFHTEPFDHQAQAFNKTCGLESYALFWEQGCGKTKPTIDTAAYLFELGKIDALVVIAPNGVHRNWITEELAIHLPPRVGKNTKTMFWQSQKAKNKAHSKLAGELLYHKGFSVLAMSYDALITKPAKSYLDSFLGSRKAMLVADEAHCIKSPKAQRTKEIMRVSKKALYRRVLTGTPITKPFDVYSQIHFLDDQFWKRHGMSNYTTFKFNFGLWRIRKLGGGRQFYELMTYKNLDDLERMIAEKGHRLTKEQCLSLPPKLYSKRFFDLSPKQRQVYDDFARYMCVKFSEEESVSTNLAVTMLLRLQQITSGYLPLDGKDELVRIEDNARLDAFGEWCEGINRQAIVWARFSEDIDQIISRLEDYHGPNCAVRYDGHVSDEKRALGKEQFQKGVKQWFVGNPQAGGTGLTLIGAKHVAYYSNSFRLLDRLQSEDRCHRIGQTDAVDYTDFIANDTVDDKIVKALRSGFDIASQLLGDQLREWI